LCPPGAPRSQVASAALTTQYLRLTAGITPMITPFQLTRSVRGLNRLRQIAQVLTRHGFGHIVAQINLSRFVPVAMLGKKRRDRRFDDGASAVGRRLARVCTELGPTFIKLGQVISTRPDIFPLEVLQALKSLQDDVPPFDTPTAMGIIAEQLGEPVEGLFDWIADSPIGSASIGQVYQAKLHNGTDVMIKVRRPDIEQTITLDMQVLHWLAESLENLMPELRIYRPTLLVTELEEMLTRELDYVNEAAVTSRVADAFEDEPGVRVPKVYWELSGSRILTTQALRGKNIETLLTPTDSTDAEMDRGLIARRLADCYLKQIFELGVFHADPHPGNILVHPPAGVGLIDFGQVGTITDELMTQLVIMVYAAVNREIDVVIDVLGDVGALGPTTNRRQLHRALQILIDKYYGLPLSRLDLTTLTNEFADVIRQHDVVIQRDLLLLAKAMATVSGVIARIDPSLDLLELIKPRITRAMSQRFAPSQLSKGGLVWGWHLFSLVRHGPAQLREFVRGMRSGSWKLHVQHENLDRLVNELDRSSNRLAFSVVIAAIIVGSSVVISAASDLTVFGFPVQYFGIAGYLFAGVLGLGLSWAIFRSGRLH